MSRSVHPPALDHNNIPMFGDRYILWETSAGYRAQVDYNNLFYCYH